MSRFNRPRFALSFLLAGAIAAFGLASAGCGSVSTADTSSAPVAEQGDQSEAGGIPGFVSEALQQVDLRPDQKAAVAQIQADVVKNMAPVRAARKDLALLLSDQVQKGAIDQAALDAAIEKVANAATAAKPALQAGLEKLHGTLDAAQRTAFVDAMKKHGGEKAHEGFGGARRERLQKLADDLGLSPDQRKDIKAAIVAEMKGHRGDHASDRDGKRAQMKAIATAFESDVFDAKALDVGKNLPEMTKAGAERIVKLTTIALPKLTQPQRDKLASIIKARADRLN